MSGPDVRVSRCQEVERRVDQELERMKTADRERQLREQQQQQGTPHTDPQQAHADHAAHHHLPHHHHHADDSLIGRALIMMRHLSHAMSGPLTESVGHEQTL
eukprot:3940908-Rhodomonas_salina.2